jgi:hypothetical protein
MDDFGSYRIEVRSQVTEDNLNAIGEAQAMEVQMGPASTTLILRADQSGLIGLLRQLHARGLVLLSVQRTR